MRTIKIEHHVETKVENLDWHGSTVPTDVHSYVVFIDDLKMGTRPTLEDALEDAKFFSTNKPIHFHLKIGAVKLVKERTGMSLKDSKELVDALEHYV